MRNIFLSSCLFLIACEIENDLQDESTESIDAPTYFEEEHCVYVNGIRPEGVCIENISHELITVYYFETLDFWAHEEFELEPEEYFSSLDPGYFCIESSDYKDEEADMQLSWILGGTLTIFPQGLLGHGEAMICATVEMIIP